MINTAREAKEIASEVMDMVNDRFTSYPRDYHRSLEQRIAEFVETRLDSIVEEED